MREQAECRHRKDGICTCPTNTFAPFKCPYADPDASQKEGYIPCPDWEGTTIVHKPKRKMRVYAVIERCSDDYYPDYTIVNECVYLKKEDAKKRLNELVKEHKWLDYEIYDFEVKE